MDEEMNFGDDDSDEEQTEIPVYEGGMMQREEAAELVREDIKPQVQENYQTPAQSELENAVEKTEPPISEVESQERTELAVQCNLESVVSEEPEIAETQSRDLKVNYSDESKYFDGFKVIKELGEGGVCKVYLVEQGSTGGRFAAKTLSKTGLENAMKTNPDARSVMINLLREEARLTNKYGGDDNFAIDFTRIGEEAFILTKYFPVDFVERVSQVPVEKRIEYFLQAAAEIAVMNKDGITLGDINIKQFRIDGKDRARLVDRNLKHSDKKAEIISMMHSIATSMIGSKANGTLRYMAPEQKDLIEGKPAKIDQRTDVYQLSSLLHEMITGEQPEGKWEDIEVKHPEFAELDKIVHKGMAKKQDKRYASVDELINAVREKTKVQEKFSDAIFGALAKSVQNMGEIEDSLKTTVKTLEEKAKEVGTLDTAKTMASFLWKAVRGVYEAIAAIPTNFRKIGERDDEAVPRIIGTIFGSAFLYGGTFAGTEQGPKALVAGIAANVVSGAYELWRHSKNKVAEKMKDPKYRQAKEDEQFLNKIADGDFSMYANRDDFEYNGDFRMAGAKNLVRGLGGGEFTREALAKELVERKYARNGKVADEMIGILKKKIHLNWSGSEYVHILEKSNIDGEKLYHIYVREDSGH